VTLHKGAIGDEYHGSCGVSQEACASCLKRLEERDTHLLEVLGGRIASAEAETAHLKELVAEKLRAMDEAVAVTKATVADKFLTTNEWRGAVDDTVTKFVEAISTMRIDSYSRNEHNVYAKAADDKATALAKTITERSESLRDALDTRVKPLELAASKSEGMASQDSVNRATMVAAAGTLLGIVGTLIAITGLVLNIIR
jgi:hypothetical protein